MVEWKARSLGMTLLGVAYIGVALAIQAHRPWAVLLAAAGGLWIGVGMVLLVVPRVVWRAHLRVVETKQAEQKEEAR